MLFRYTENPPENRFFGSGFLRLGGWRSAIRKTVPFRTSDTSAGPLIYAGKKRKLSAWAADDGRLLREEFYQAAQRLAEQIVERVFAG